jgi:hypothetical protein
LFFLVSSVEKLATDMFLSFNGEDIKGKLDVIKVTIDPITGEAKYLKELNSLGKRKQKPIDPCANDKKQTKSISISFTQIRFFFFF